MGVSNVVRYLAISTKWTCAYLYNSTLDYCLSHWIVEKYRAPRYAVLSVAQLGIVVSIYCVRWFGLTVVVDRGMRHLAGRLHHKRGECVYFFSFMGWGATSLRYYYQLVIIRTGTAIWTLCVWRDGYGCSAVDSYAHFVVVVCHQGWDKVDSRKGPYSKRSLIQRTQLRATCSLLVFL